MPAVIHPRPDPAAIALCRDLAAATGAECVILFGSRATGGWDEQSDLDLIVVHPAANDDDDRRKAVGRVLARLKERHYPGYRDYVSLHHGVKDGQMVKTPAEHVAGRSTLNHVMARAAREGLIFTRNPGAEFAAATMVTSPTSGSWSRWSAFSGRPRSTAASIVCGITFPWYADGDPPARRHRINVHTSQGRNAHELLWNSGAAPPVHPGRNLPRESVAEMAIAIAHHDAGWTHEFRSDLDRIDQYSACGCEVVITDPIDDVPTMWRNLEIDRDALWERIHQLSEYDLTQAQGRSGGVHVEA